MRRPLAFVLAYFIAGVYARYTLWLRPLGGVLLTGVLLVALLLGGGRRERPRPVRLLLAALLLFGCGMGVLSLHMYLERTDAYALRAGEVVTAGGLVTRETVTSEKKHRLTLRTDTGEHLLVYAEGEGLWSGRHVVVRGELRLPESRRNPGGYDEALYLRSRGIHAVLYARTVQVKGVESRWRWTLARWRESFSSWALSYLDEEEHAVLAALLFGDKSGMEDEDYDAFQRNGTAHILAVSGLHIGFFYGLLATLFGRRGKGRVFLLPPLFLYAALAGFSSSVMRAVVMIALHVLAEAGQRRYDGLTAVLFAAVLLLAVRPFALFTAGFQLSFLAVLALCFLVPWCERSLLPRLARGRRRAYGMVLWERSLISLCLPFVFLTLVLLPATAYLFHYISWSGLIAGFPMVFLAGLLVPLGLLLLIAQPALTAAFTAGILPVSMGKTLLSLGGETAARGVRALLLCNRLTYQGGRFTRDAVSPPLFLLVLFYGLLFFCLSETAHTQRARGHIRLQLRMFVLVATFAILTAYAFATGFFAADVVFVDVGQGACVHIRAGEGRHLLVDGGGSRTRDVGGDVVLPYLLTVGTSEVDVAFVSHPDLDHYDGVVSLCRAGKVRNVVFFEGCAKEAAALCEETGLSAEHIFLASAGERLRIGDTEIAVLWPAAGTVAEGNEQSLVLRVETGGVRLLLTGDIGRETEEALCELYGTEAGGVLDVDVLQVPHHGSRYSSSESFLTATSPRIAVVQSGRNTYGHPAAEALERYEAAGIPVIRNDKEGATGMDLSRGTWVTMRSGRLEAAWEK